MNDGQRDGGRDHAFGSDIGHVVVAGEILNKILAVVDDIVQVYLKGVHIRGPGIHHRMEIIVPVIDRIQQADGGDHRFGHGAHDGHQRAQISGAVDPGGFLYTFRQAFKIIFHNEHIELHDGERQDAGGIGIQQPQASYDHISGDHTDEKHHADDIQQ